jgi:GH15 family glucan-1,4-alpha-glucosidase
MSENTLHQEKPSKYLTTLWYLIRIAVGAFVGWFTFRAVSYFRRLFKQPYLPPYSVDLKIGEFTPLQYRGLAIATANLQDGIEKRLLPDGSEKLVLCAGRRNFREPWARDLSFASFGLVELGEYQVVRESLEAFLINQRPSGQFPIKVRSNGVFNRFLHSLFRREQPILAPLQPKYMSGHGTVSLDGNALLVVASLNYAARSGDDQFLADHWPALKQAWLWLQGYAREDGLLEQAAYSDWADTIARKGRVLYTNIAYWKALNDMAQSAAHLGEKVDEAHFSSEAARLGSLINAYFWSDDLGYYITSEGFENLSSGGNLLAIAWGLASPDQANAILAHMDRFDMANPIPTKPVYPPYPNRFIALENRLGRIGFYHTNAAWLWLGAWHVIALSQARRFKEAQEYMDRISEVIVRDGAVHEVFAPDGRYINGFWYNSEAPFTWSAGMVVYANFVLKRRLVGENLLH